MGGQGRRRKGSQEDRRRDDDDNDGIYWYFEKVTPDFDCTCASSKGERVDGGETEQASLFVLFLLFLISPCDHKLTHCHLVTTSSHSVYRSDSSIRPRILHFPNLSLIRHQNEREPWSESDPLFLPSLYSSRA